MRRRGERERSSALLCGAEAAEARRELGGPGNGEERVAQRRHGDGDSELGERGRGWHFCQNPLVSFFLCFLLFLFSPVAFLGFIWGT